MNDEVTRIIGEPLVSVITIFYNSEKFIQEAIESVLAQSYRNWELLLVDDGSTDGSTRVALDYAKRHPGKVRYLEHTGHQNLGKSDARNLGIRQAKGEYIGFLDSDDVWLPRKLEEQLSILASRPEIGALIGRTQFWFSWTGKLDDIRRDFLAPLGVEPDTVVHPPKLVTFFLGDENSIPYPSSILFRQEVVRGSGGFEEGWRDVYEDTAFFAKVFLGTPVFVASQCWTWYRQHPENSCMIAVQTGQWHPVRPNPLQRHFLNWMEEYLSRQGITDAEVWRALRKGLRPYRYPILSLPLTYAHYAAYAFRKVTGIGASPTEKAYPVRWQEWSSLLLRWLGRR